MIPIEWTGYFPEKLSGKFKWTKIKQKQAKVKI